MSYSRPILSDEELLMNALNDWSGDDADNSDYEKETSSSSSSSEDFTHNNVLPSGSKNLSQSENHSNTAILSKISRNKRETSKDMRLKGLQYKSSSGKDSSSRTMGPRCESNFCLKSSLRSCTEIDDESRKKFFDKFWCMHSWDGRKTYIRALVSTEEVRQRKSESSKRESFTYSLQLNNGKMFPVCKSFFASTLGIPLRTIGHWIIGNSSGEAPKSKRPRSGKTNSITDANLEYLLSWLKEVPTVSSHYCRSIDTYKNKRFVYPGTTIANLHREYEKSAIESSHRAAGLTLFKDKFHNENYSVFTPRKDQCDTCIGAKYGNIDRQQHQEHLLQKEKAREAKNEDKNLANEKISVWTVDVQAVLICPKTLASTMYYKQKLQIHNLTFYNLSNRNGYCYVWNECKGDLNSETFTCLYYEHFNRIISECPAIEKIIIWSDGCGYQNRNAALSNIFIHMAKTLQVEIIQKYLVAGHTQMECDSMHSAIERKIVYDIFIPRDYHVIMQTARIKPKPYTVTPLKHDSFFKLSKSYLASIRPGKKAGDPTVFNLRSLRYEPDGKVSYLLSFDQTSAWSILPQRISPNESPNWIRMHSNQLPIKKKKYDDLQAIKSVIPKEYHSFYDNLPWH